MSIECWMSVECAVCSVQCAVLCSVFLPLPPGGGGSAGNCGGLPGRGTGGLGLLREQHLSRVEG